MQGAGDDHPDRARFESWLAADRRHADEFAAFSDTWAQLQSGASPHGLEDALKRRLERNRVSRRTVVRKVLPAVAAFGVGLEGWAVHRDHRVVWRFARASGAGQVLHETLPDGSTVAIGGRSRVDVDASRAGRNARLADGTVAFDVAPDNDRPFVVLAGPAKVRSVDGRFAVDLLARAVRISVVRGMAAVEVGPFWRRLTSVLSAGQVAEVSSAGPLPALQARPERRAEDAFAFEHGTLVFDRADLAEVAETLSRYRDAPVKFRPGPRSPRIVAAVQLRDVETFIDLLPTLGPIDVRRDGDRVVLGVR